MKPRINWLTLLLTAAGVVAGVFLAALVQQQQAPAKPVFPQYTALLLPLVVGVTVAGLLGQRASPSARAVTPGRAFGAGVLAGVVGAVATVALGTVFGV